MSLTIVNVTDRPGLEGYPEVQGGLEKYRRIPVWDPNSMRNDGMPLGRLLSIADYFDCGVNDCLNGHAHLAGVR